MFSGLVQAGAFVEEIRIFETFHQIVISFGSSEWKKMNPVLGSSIAINGVCLSVVEFKEIGDQVLAHFDVSPETLRLTNLSQILLGSEVHFEPSLKVGSELGGHWVQGHVDGTAELTRFEKNGEGFEMDIQIAGDFYKKMAAWVIDKGSISIDGVSLTINQIIDSADSMTLKFFLIPHTLENTHFKNLKIGSKLNIEADVIGKYLLRLNQVKGFASLSGDATNAQ